MKKIIVAGWLMVLTIGLVLIFWYNEWVYSLPTPVPVAYKTVHMGTHLNLPGSIDSLSGKPVLLHFFNPDCPCSRFNIPHFKSLVKKYGDQVAFVVVPVILSASQYTAQEIQEKFDLNIPVLFDPSLAIASGVYATPQAVILDVDHKLYYRGNYNKSRYCTDKKSNYAQMALDSLLARRTNQMFSPLALKAYGCQLPTCTIR